MTDERDPALEALVRENYLLRTWIAGFIAGCEECIAQATKWAEAMELQHEFTDTDEDT